MIKLFRMVAVLSFAMLFVHNANAQSRNENEVATLYRSSVVIKNARIHIATFDEKGSLTPGSAFEYNWENCQLAAKLFQNQEGVVTKFWCEKGFHKK